MIRVLIVIFLLLVLRGTSFSQSNYLMSLENVIKINDFTYSFDIFIQNINEDFLLTSYQCSFQFDCNDILNDEFTFSYSNNSSELSNKPVFGIATRETDGHPELTFASNAGNDLIDNKKRVGQFILKRKLKFKAGSFSANWNFDGVNSTIITGKNFNNVTNPENFVSPFSLTEAEDSAEQKISNYQLFQNYPNPFNPSTTIRYSIPNTASSQITTLKIYDILGNEVAVLLNKIQPYGNYEIKFDGSNLASGVYFFRLSSGKFIQTKKMILAK